MRVNIYQVGISSLPIYASISISFRVESFFRIQVINHGLGGFRLCKEKVDPPYLKDYDAAGCDGSPETPLDWPRLFNTTNWGFFLAYEGEKPVGGAAIALHSAGVNMLEDRQDLAVLWDIRVRPEFRGQGVGGQLFRQAASWAKSQPPAEDRNPKRECACLPLLRPSGLHSGRYQPLRLCRLPVCGA